MIKNKQSIKMLCMEIQCKFEMMEMLGHRPVPLQLPQLFQPKSSGLTYPPLTLLKTPVHSTKGPLLLIILTLKTKY